MSNSEERDSSSTASESIDKVARWKTLFPWARWSAKFVDGVVFIALLTAVVAVISYADEGLARSIESLAPSRIASTGLFVILFPLFDAVQLRVFSGQSFGRWLFRFRVLSKKSDASDKVPFRIALLRSYDLVFRGLGAGIPFVSLLTQGLGYMRLYENGESDWDRKYGLRVEHRGPTWISWTVGGTLIVTVIVLRLLPRLEGLIG